MKMAKLIEEATRLPEDDRVRLAERLLATLDGEPDAGAARAWSREVNKRSQQIEQGLVKPIPWSTVKKSANRQARGRS